MTPVVHRARCIVIAALLTAALLAVPATSAGATLPLYNGRIAFVRMGVGMMTVTADGLGLHLQQDLDALGGPIGWSADGSRLAFNGWDPDDGSGFYTMNAFGSDRTRHFVDNRAGGMAWSPDGTRVARSMWSEADGNRITVSDLDGTNETVLRPTDRTDRNNGPDASPAWSPDGSRIAFESTTSRVTRIWIMDADGSDAHEVPGLPAGGTRQPAFSPDGERLVFISDPEETHEFGRLFVVGLDGSGGKTIGPASRYLGFPQFSPQGSQIVFSSFGAHYTADEASGLYVIDADGSSLHRLTHHPDTVPKWQPLESPLPNLPARALGTSQMRLPLSLFGNADTSFDGDGSIVRYEWRWGDNTAMTPKKYAWHKYAAPGTYLVRLTVTDDDGARTTKKAWIRVT